MFGWENAKTTPLPTLTIMYENSGTAGPEESEQGVWGSPPRGEVWRGGTQNARETQRFWQAAVGSSNGRSLTAVSQPFDSRLTALPGIHLRFDDVRKGARTRAEP